ncbi:MAG: hypothetical protein GY749_05500 [Desulfobacteraceae bacterium]|nr:hypothetical protein [Desulfobacteraceae bacterium]
MLKDFPEYIRVVIGPGWTADAPFSDGDILILQRVLNSPGEVKYSENGSTVTSSSNRIVYTIRHSVDTEQKSKSWTEQVHQTSGDSASSSVTTTITENYTLFSPETIVALVVDGHTGEASQQWQTSSIAEEEAKTYSFREKWLKGESLDLPFVTGPYNSAVFSDLTEFIAPTTQRTFIRLLLFLPVGSIVAKAVLQMTAARSDNSDVSVRIAAADGINLPVPATAAELESLPLTEGTEWDVPAFAEGEIYETPDITAAVQTVINRSDYAPGATVMIILENTAASPLRNVRRIFSSSGITPPQLLLNSSQNQIKFDSIKKII